MNYTNAFISEEDIAIVFSFGAETEATASEPLTAFRLHPVEWREDPSFTVPVKPSVLSGTGKAERLDHAKLDLRIFDHSASGSPAGIRGHSRDSGLDR